MNEVRRNLLGYACGCPHARPSFIPLVSASMTAGVTRVRGGVETSAPTQARAATAGPPNFTGARTRRTSTRRSRDQHGPPTRCRPPAGIHVGHARRPPHARGRGPTPDPGRAPACRAGPSSQGAAALRVVVNLRVGRGAGRRTPGGGHLRRRALDPRGPSDSGIRSAGGAPPARCHLDREHQGQSPPHAPVKPHLTTVGIRRARSVAAAATIGSRSPSFVATCANEPDPGRVVPGPR